MSNHVTIGQRPYWQQSSRKSTQVIYPIKRENNCTIASRVKNYSLKITIVMYLICQSNLYFYVSLIKSSLKKETPGINDSILLLPLGFTFDDISGNLTSVVLYYYTHLLLVGVNRPPSDNTINATLLLSHLPLVGSTFTTTFYQCHHLQYWASSLLLNSASDHHFY